MNMTFTKQYTLDNEEPLWSVTVDSSNGADFDVLAGASSATTSASPTSAGSGAGVLLEYTAPVVAAGSASVPVAACVPAKTAAVCDGAVTIAALDDGE